MIEMKGCPWCGIEPRLFGKDKVQCINEFNCPNAYGRPIKLDEWQKRPIEDALRAENEVLRERIDKLEKLLIEACDPGDINQPIEIAKEQRGAGAIAPPEQD